MANKPCRDLNINLLYKNMGKAVTQENLPKIMQVNNNKVFAYFYKFNIYAEMQLCIILSAFHLL